MNKKLKNKIRFFLFNTLGRLHFRITNENDLLVFSSSRSGSTWFVESLLENNRFMLYNQPFDNLLNVNIYDRLLPIKDNPFLINLTKNEINKVKKYFYYLRAGKVFNNVNWRLFDKYNYIFYKRKLFKVFFAKEIYKIFLDEKNLDIVYLTRHPLTRAYSNIKYGYPDGCKYLLHNENLIKMIGQENVNKIKHIFSYSGELEKHVLGWFLENYHLLSYIENNKSSILHIKYEDMITQSKHISEKLSKHIEINVDKMVFSEQPSSTTHKEQVSTLSKRRLNANSTYDISELSYREKENILNIFKLFPQKSYFISL